MSNELENIILIIDTREQNQRRIKAVEEWALSHGAIVEHSALKLCDYSLIGEFRGVSVNIGIEAKSLSDFATSYSELSDKLARSYQLYDDVALFIESGNYTFTPDTDNFHAIIDNPMVRNGNANVLSLAVYENMLASLQREGVHVRQLRSEAHFPYAIAGLLITITKPIHTGLKELIRNGCSSARYGELTKKEYIAAYSNILGKFPQLGFKRIDKIMKHYPNMFWLCSASEESLIQVMGKQVGMTLYALLRNQMLVTNEWRNNFHRDGTEKDKPKKLICSACGLDKCTCVPHSNNPKNFKQDDEGRPAFDVPAKNPILSEKAQKGVVIMTEHAAKCIDCQTKFDEIIIHSKCSFADPKNRAECKHPDHFKHHSSHQDKVTVSPLLPDDISSHPGSNSTTTIIPKPDDPQRPPIIHNQISEEKQEEALRVQPPAETNIGLDDKPLDMVVKCRACHQTIDDCNDDETGFCQDPDCIKIRNEPSLENKLRIYLREPHSVEEIVEEYGCSTGYTYQVCINNVKAGNLKKITEPNGKITFQRIS